MQTLGTSLGAQKFSSATGTGTATVPAGGNARAVVLADGNSPDGPFPTVLNAGIVAVSIAKTTVTEDTSSDQYGGG